MTRPDKFCPAFSFAVYNPYGTTQTTYGCTGEQFNATSGLLYLRARYYNPNLRVFTAKDPFAGNMQNPASMHGYSYAHNNPILYTDPTGKYIESPIDAAFIGFDILSLGYNLYYGYTAQTHADRVYYSNQASIDVVALAIDFGMLGTPGATGGGMVYRFAMAGGKTIDIVIDCSKLAKVAQQGSVKLAQVLPHILTAQSGSGNGGGSGGSGSSSSSGGKFSSGSHFSSDGQIIAQNTSRKGVQKVDILFENRNNAMVWAKKQLGNSVERIYDSSGKWIGWQNANGNKVYWGHGDWGKGVGNSTFPHLNYVIDGVQGHLFLKDKIVNRGEWLTFAHTFGLKP